MKIGIDIGGTNIRVAMIDNNSVEKIKVFVSKPDNSKESLEEIFLIIDEFTNNNHIESIGIAVPGPIDIENGIILETHNLPDWNNLNIKQVFKNKFKTKVFVNNDANIAALGQAILHKDAKSLLYLTISTGIGAGFINGDKIFSGYNGTALEIANALPYKDDNGNWNKTGIEFNYSGRNIPKALKRLGVLVKDAEEAFSLYYENKNKTINDYFAEMKDKYITFLSTSIYLLNPHYIVFGGSVAMSNQKFFNDIFREVNKVVIDVDTNIVYKFAEKQDVATVLGCAAMK